MAVEYCPDCGGQMSRIIGYVKADALAHAGCLGKHLQHGRQVAVDDAEPAAVDRGMDHVDQGLKGPGARTGTPDWLSSSSLSTPGGQPCGPTE